jgi:ABC-type cobalamin/Fe3+-siderophores transport system ATPase subunit
VDVPSVFAINSLGRFQTAVDVDLTIKNYRCFSDEKSARIKLRKGFTAFVGPNNSGKSSLMKFFYEFRGLFEQIGSQPGVIAQALSGPQAFNLASNIADHNEVFCNLNDRDLTVELRFPPSLTPPNTPPLTELRIKVPRGRNAFHITSLPPGSNGPVDIAAGRFSVAVSDTGRFLQQKDAVLFDCTELQNVCKSLSETLYIGAFRNALNVTALNNYFDIQIGEAFVKQWQDSKLGSSKSLNEIAYRVERDIKEIFEYSEFQINPSNDIHTLSLLINDKSYRLSEVGSGISQFILVLMTAAVKRPCYLMVDEPELNLHPSLQRRFLTSLGAYAREGVLFATHSVGLARANSQAVYTLRRQHGQASEVMEYGGTPRLAEFLGELSFFGYKELGFDKILLVEGTKDVLAIQQFLRLFGKDHQIVMLPLGGRSLINGQSSTAIQLEEIKRISDNVFALIDSERSAPAEPLEPERIKFKELCEQGRIPCHILERRAIENYFSDRAIKACKGEKYRELERYQLLREAQYCWSKEENWLIAREMKVEEIESTDLGKFLAKL